MFYCLFQDNFNDPNNQILFDESFVEIYEFLKKKAHLTAVRDFRNQANKANDRLDPSPQNTTTLDNQGISSPTYTKQSPNITLTTI